MFYQYLKRGLIAGLIGGTAYGVFVAVVATPLITHAESFEQGHSEAAVSELVAITTSIGAGVGWGLLLGLVVFGAVYFFLEPAIPGRPDTKSYLLGAAGFITASGAPWLILPPVPPGVENALPTETRITWYVIMMVAGAFACGLAGYTYRRLRHRVNHPIAIAGALLPFALLAIPVVVAPANPVTGPIPGALATAFSGMVATGQLVLWLGLSGTHAWLIDRAPEATTVGTTTVDPAVSSPDT